MNCKDVQELLPLHVGGDLAAKKTQSVSAHLAHCSDCAASASEYRDSFQFTKNFEPPVFSAEFYDGIRQSVMSEIEQGRVGSKPWFSASLLSRTFRLRPEGAVAAVLVIAVFAFYFIGNRKISPDMTVKAPNSNHQKEVVPTKSPEVAGPLVTLNPLDKETQRVVSSGPTVRKPRLHKGTRPITEPIYSARPINSTAESIAASPPAPKTPETPLRVELQTNDSNIRIIWFTYQNAKQDSPGKGF